MPLRAFLAALVLAVAHVAAAADVVGYSEAFDTLFRVDLTTRTAQEIGRATPLGAPRYSIIDGLTFNPNGLLYGVSDAGAVKTLLRISNINGLAVRVGTLELGTDHQLDLGLAFTADGHLWLSSSPGDFWQVDPATAAVTHVGNLGVKITGLTSVGNVLYGAGGQGNNNLYRIDPDTASASLVGAYGSGVSYVSAASPAFDDSGQLWVLLDYVPPLNPPTPEWSDLARGAASGTLDNLGPVTATANTPSFDDLQFIGLRGLAITPPVPGGGNANVSSTPALSWPALLALPLLLMLFAGTRLRRCRPKA
jgi:hypothetical protein